MTKREVTRVVQDKDGSIVEKAKSEFWNGLVEIGISQDTITEQLKRLRY